MDMTKDELTELLKIAYRWGRDNGSNRSVKNFNDLIQTEAISEALSQHDVRGSLPFSKCKCGQNTLLYKAQIEIDKCSRCGNAL